MKRLSLAIAAAAALLTPVVAPAQTLRQFSRKDLVIQVDPNLSYIFYRTGVQAPMTFIREPDAADVAAWQVARDQAFEKLMKRYRSQMRDWRQQTNSWNRLSPSRRGGMRAPVKPVMPSQENFAFTTIEMMTMTEGGISPAFFKEKPIFGFLIAVKPGTYSFYGSTMLLGTGYAGTCMCMGTVKFDARPGEIVDLGIFGFHGIAPGARLPRMEPYAHPLPSEFRPFDGPLPTRLQGLPVRPAEFRAAGKFPNYFGVAIDRLYPMPGVLSYRRDMIIDDRTGQPLARQSGTAQ